MQGAGNPVLEAPESQRNWAENWKTYWLGNKQFIWNALRSGAWGAKGGKKRKRSRAGLRASLGGRDLAERSSRELICLPPSLTNAQRSAHHPIGLLFQGRLPGCCCYSRVALT